MGIWNNTAFPTGLAPTIEHMGVVLLREFLPSSNPILVTDLADLSICKVDLEHVFRRPDHADRGTCAGIKNFGSVFAVLDRCHISVIAS